MQKDEEIKFVSGGKTETPELPPPESASVAGSRELVRLWHDKENYSIQMRRELSSALDWSEPLAFCAKSAANLYLADMPDVPDWDTPQKLSVVATAILLRAVEYIGVHKPSKTGLPEEAFDDIDEDDDDDDYEEVMEHAHPGSLDLHPLVAQDETAKQLLSVWFSPPVEGCDNCGGSHESQTFIGGSTDELDSKKVGELLADIAVTHAGGVGGDMGERLKTLGVIQQAFHDRLAEGVTRA